MIAGKCILCGKADLDATFDCPDGRECVATPEGTLRRLPGQHVFIFDRKAAWNEAVARKPHEETWRVGRKVGRTLYREGEGEGVLIGVMDTREEAQLAAAAPDLARALLANEWCAVTDLSNGKYTLFSSCPECGGAKPGEDTAWRRDNMHDLRVGHGPECGIDLALRKAGVR